MNLIERLREADPFEHGDNYQLLKEAADALERYQWVSVEDRLPELDEVVLIALRCESWPDPEKIDLGGRTDGGDGWYWCHSEHWCQLESLDYQYSVEVDITHWMPLPNSPTAHGG